MHKLQNTFKPTDQDKSLKRIQPSDPENRKVTTGRNENRGASSIINSAVFVANITSDRANIETCFIAERQTQIKSQHSSCTHSDPYYHHYLSFLPQSVMDELLIVSL